MLIPSNHIPDSSSRYLFQTSRRILFLYFLIITIFISVIVSLPFLYVDISVVTPGIVRPSDERTEVKSATAGFISVLKYREGEFVKKDSMLAALQQHHLAEKRVQLSDRIKELRKYMRDLKILLRPNPSVQSNSWVLNTALYREQLLSFNHRVAEHV